MLIVDGAYGVVDVVEDASLDDTWAAEPREPGGGRTAKIMRSSRHFDGILRRLTSDTPSGSVLSNAQRLLREVSSGAWRWKDEHVIEFPSRLEQLDRLVRQHDVVRLAVLGLTYRPHAAIQVHIAPAAGDYFAGTAAGK